MSGRMELRKRDEVFMLQIVVGVFGRFHIPKETKRN